MSVSNRCCFQALILCTNMSKECKINTKQKRLDFFFLVVRIHVMILCVVGPCNQIDCYCSITIFTTPVF